MANILIIEKEKNNKNGLFIRNGEKKIAKKKENRKLGIVLFPIM